MIFNHRVKHNGITYEAGQDVPIEEVSVGTEPVKEVKVEPKEEPKVETKPEKAKPKARPKRKN